MLIRKLETLHFVTVGKKILSHWYKEAIYDGKRVTAFRMKYGPAVKHWRFFFAYIGTVARNKVLFARRFHAKLGRC